jgi:hypothetical protein
VIQTGVRRLAARPGYLKLVAKPVTISGLVAKYL